MNNKKNIGKNEYLFFFSSILIFIAANIISIWKEVPFVSLIPIVLIFVAISLRDYRVLFFMMLASLPISMDIGFGALTLSTPAEPLLILSSGIWIILLINKRAEVKHYINNPLVIILLLQLLLFSLNIFISKDPVLSLKYLLAKIWFFGGFIFLPILILKNEKAFKIAFWSFLIPLLISIFYTVINHALTGFSFEEVNQSARPIYANHVIYACTLGLSLPFTIAAIGWYKNNSLIRTFLIASVLLIVFAIITSFTRTTWLAVIAAAGSIIIFRSKYLKLTFVVGAIGLFIFCYELVDNNNYMRYAPNYSTTVFNKEDFSKHMAATVELSDVSGMERVYRWVAAVNLIQHNFWLGTGNNTFYPTYKEYANPAFITYVSDNPEGSSTHNYFLLIFCDQGVFGFLLFSILYIWAMLKAKYVYQIAKDKFTRNLMIASFSTLVLFLVHLFLGDMIEVEKNGGIFMLIIAILISSEHRVKSELLQS